MLWPGSAALSNFILANSKFFENKNVVELGSGAGLCGLWTARFAKKVVLTDCEDSVLQLLSINIQRNHFQTGMKKI